jgi:corrinoid protein of di/trimethylamine methyltransferase
MEILSEISSYLQQGRASIVKDLVNKALQEGIGAQQILDDGLLFGMSIIGEKFKNNEVYVPDVLISARAMNAGVELLKTKLSKTSVKSNGKVILGTVKGDLHDIGKNLVKIMMEGKGLEVIDIGVDASIEKFIDTAIHEKAQVVACSALLTTTMGIMQDVIQYAIKKGVRKDFKIMVGGAPITQKFCETIGADYYASDASTASEIALAICQDAKTN